MKKLLAAIGCTLAMLGLLAATASAQHVWGEAEWDSTIPNGASVEISHNYLHVQDPVRDFMDEEVWVVFKDGYWVEAGATTGSELHSKSTLPKPTYFWCQDSPIFGYVEHFDTTGPKPGRSFRVTIVAIGNGRFRLRAGTFRATSTADYGPVVSIIAGDEYEGPARDTHYFAAALFSDLRYHERGAGWVNGWGASTYLAWQHNTYAAWGTPGRSFGATVRPTM